VRGPRLLLCGGGVAEALGVELLPLVLLLHGQLLALVRRGQDVEKGGHAVRGDDQPCGRKRGRERKRHQDVGLINLFRKGRMMGLLTEVCRPILA